MGSCARDAPVSLDTVPLTHHPICENMSNVKKSINFTMDEFHKKFNLTQ